MTVCFCSTFLFITSPFNSCQVCHSLNLLSFLLSLFACHTVLSTNKANKGGILKSGASSWLGLGWHAAPEPGVLFFYCTSLRRFHTRVLSAAKPMWTGECTRAVKRPGKWPTFPFWMVMSWPGIEKHLRKRAAECGWDLSVRRTMQHGHGSTFSHHCQPVVKLCQKYVF